MPGALGRVQSENSVRTRLQVYQPQALDSLNQQRLLFTAGNGARGRVEAEDRRLDARQEILRARMTQQPVEAAEYLEIGSSDFGDVPVAQTRIGFLGQESRRAIDRLCPPGDAQCAQRLLPR